MALLIDYIGLAKADNRLSKIISHVFSLLFWIAFAISSLNYQSISGGTGLESSSQALALIGLIGTVVTLVLLLAVGLGGVTETYQDA